LHHHLAGRTVAAGDNGHHQAGLLRPKGSIQGAIGVVPGQDNIVTIARGVGLPYHHYFSVALQRHPGTPGIVTRDDRRHHPAGAKTGVQRAVQIVARHSQHEGATIISIPSHHDLPIRLHHHAVGRGSTAANRRRHHPASAKTRVQRPRRAKGGGNRSKATDD